MTGKNLVAIMVDVATMNTGRGFTFCADIERLPKDLGEISEEKLQELAGKEVARRMERTNRAFSKLLDLCKKSGVLWKHPERGWAVEIDKELTPAEQSGIEKVLEELRAVDTFMENAF